MNIYTEAGIEPVTPCVADGLSLASLEKSMKIFNKF